MTSRRKSNPWLILLHQAPKDAGSLRVRIWRRLQQVGAVAVKNSVYVLPAGEQAQEDFEWILKELLAGGGEGAILQSQFVSGLGDQQVEALFNSARSADYDQLVEDLRSLQLADGTAEQSEDDERIREVAAGIGRLKQKFKEIDAIDFFGANGRETALALLDSIEASMAAAPATDGGESLEGNDRIGVSGRVWVTRQHVFVDRIASAWLIRRWIDSEAVFKFAAQKDYTPAAGEVRFDMFEAEYTHEGDKCTFEVLLGRFAISDPALECIAQIVHDIDLKDHKYRRAETIGVANLISGIVAGIDDDQQRLERGRAMFDDLYRFFQASQKK